MGNKYPGKCHACGKAVGKLEGDLERVGRKWVVWCKSCYNKSDNSGAEDRMRGDRAYEDACAAACGLDSWH